MPSLVGSEMCIRDRLLTDDIKTLRQICSEYNIKVKLEPTDMEKLGCRGMLIEDPNGVEIEIVQKY